MTPYVNRPSLLCRSLVVDNVADYSLALKYSDAHTINTELLPTRLHNMKNDRSIIQVLIVQALHYACLYHAS